jgi:uncharacterized protein (TIGR00369 family)
LSRVNDLALRDDAFDTMGTDEQNENRPVSVKVTIHFISRRLAGVGIQHLSGLELMRGAVAGDFPRSAMADTIPMKMLEAELGYMKVSARADGRHLNPLGGVHGGFAATVLDSVTGCAVHTTLEAGVGYGTIDLHVKMLRPVPRDQDLVAEARTVHVSRNIAASEGTLKLVDGTLLATATATCFIKRS